MAKFNVSPYTAKLSRLNALNKSTQAHVFFLFVFFLLSILLYSQCILCGTRHTLAERSRADVSVALKNIMWLQYIDAN